ncbi:MAG: hypothetical protein JNJ43_10185 [Anaerolineales bacterium]|nr:hypothetical protein [Anaerolineales bacterium]
MKKILTFTFVIALLISACGQSVNTPVPTTELHAFTSTPESTSTPEVTPTPEKKEPYAIISADKAEFWFPIPEKEIWEWYVLPVIVKEDCGSCVIVSIEYSWYVEITENEKKTAYQISVDLMNNREKHELQSGTFEELLATSRTKIYLLGEPDSDGYYSKFDTEYTKVAISHFDNGLLIELTEPDLLKILNEQKPETIKFGAVAVDDYSNPEEVTYSEAPEFGEFTVTPEYK